MHDWVTYYKIRFRDCKLAVCCVWWGEVGSVSRLQCRYMW